MGDQFNWQFEEVEDKREPVKSRQRRRSSSITFWIVTAVITLLVISGWSSYQWRVDKVEADLIDRVQENLDLQHQAVANNDGDLFYSLQADDSQWFSAQLLPYNQAINRAGLTVTNAEEHGETIWVNAAWEDEGEPLQRILFFESRAGQLRQIATDPDYWGKRLLKEYEWGTLTYPAIDDAWADSVGNHIADRVAVICQTNCLGDRLPLTVVIGDNYQETAESGHIHIPSARLLGLDSDGRPSSSFWRNLDKRISSTLSPATIRFAVPPARSISGQTLLNYQLLAKQFMSIHREIVVEIVELDSLPDELSTLALEFDGAAVVPTEAMLAAGLVHDLDDYIESDHDFDRADFYDQIWQGALWEGRTWFMPQAAEMRVFYFDREAYSQAGYPDPSSRWTWEEMAQDVSTIVTEQPQEGHLAWGFLDVGLDALYSYAYNWNNQCTEDATVFCQTPLEDQHVAAALDWYSEMISEPDQMPDLVHHLSESFSPTQMASLETMLTDNPQTLLLNFQGSQRKAAVWIDKPVSYELNLLLAPVGVVPFPGSDRFDGITPLWMQGNFISQRSDYPLAVWEWLKFLSYQSPIARFVPARPSVAAKAGYWKRLPQPLGDVMRTAFPFARPVTVEEQKLVTWEQVADVVSGELSPIEAAQKREPIRWFGE